jgi:deoxyhypusine synthase
MEIIIKKQEIIVKEQETVQLEEIKIEFVRDLFQEKKIIARVEGLPAGVILWSGDEGYSKAGNWTNESAHDRLLEVLALSDVPWYVPTPANHKTLE